MTWYATSEDASNPVEMTVIWHDLAQSGRPSGAVRKR